MTQVQGMDDIKIIFACGECTFATTDRSDLDSHLVAVHEKSKPFTCTFCNLSFSRRHHLKTHIDKFHESPSTVNVLQK